MAFIVSELYLSEIQDFKYNFLFELSSINFNISLILL